MDEWAGEWAEGWVKEWEVVREVWAEDICRAVQDLVDKMSSTHLRPGREVIWRR